MGLAQRLGQLRGTIAVAEVFDRGDRGHLLSIALLTLGSAMFEVFSIGLIFPLVTMLADPSIVLRVPWLSAAYRLSGLQTLRYFPALCALAFLAVIVAKSAYNGFLVAYQERFFHRVAARTAARLVAIYLRSPWTMHLTRNSAELINVADVSTGWPLTGNLRSHLVLATDGLVVAGIVAVLLFIAPLPTLASVVVFGGGFYLCQRAARSHVEALGRTTTDIAGDRLRFLQQSLGSAKEVKVLGRAQWFIDQYAAARDRHARLMSQIMVWQNLPRLLVEPLLIAVVTLVIAFVTLGGVGEREMVPTLGFFAIAGLRLMPSLSRLLAAGAIILAGADPMARIRADLRRKDAEELAARTASIPPLARDFRVEDVSYRYADSGKDVLHRVSLTVAKGDSVALVGASGSGKTTLADIVLGLLPPRSGRVTADGIDIASDPGGWQRQIAYVPQSISLIDDSLRENITFGIAPGRIDPARLAHILSLLRLEDVVARAPQGLETVIGERGVRLSGGERQRIGIARALYDDRTVLIMDEATSALDNATESDVGGAIESLRGTCTILVIAHRLSTIRRCGRVILLKDGAVLDQGRFEELAARCPEFRQLLQLGESAALPL